MKTTICAKINTSDLHAIERFCKANKTVRHKWTLEAIKDRALKDGIDLSICEKTKSEPRKIKTKIKGD